MIRLFNLCSVHTVVQIVSLQKPTSTTPLKWELQVRHVLYEYYSPLPSDLKYTSPFASFLIVIQDLKKLS
jgi:hypothetical protein